MSSWSGAATVVTTMDGPEAEAITMATCAAITAAGTSPRIGEHVGIGERLPCKAESARKCAVTSHFGGERLFFVECEAASSVRVPPAPSSAPMAWKAPPFPWWGLSLKLSGIENPT